MKGILYKLDFTNGKSYIGITLKSLHYRLKEHAKRVKLGDGDGIHNAWRKHGEPTSYVLAVLCKDDIYETEKRAIKIFNTKFPNGYNLTDEGEGVAGKIVTDETKAKLRNANLGKKASLETKAKMSKAGIGRICSEETRRKIGAKNKINSKGYVKSAETIEKLRLLSIGRTHTVSEESKVKMRLVKLGRKLSEETKKRMSETHALRWSKVKRNSV
jgi:group I intron endonuclease